mmetsp:Transcript_3559/g.22376  ORF Transcript_3559/g.22376 Transcript_3559/m.22376 type:complete len:116 (-) Transcript_3559:2496-2843(-)
MHNVFFISMKYAVSKIEEIKCSWKDLHFCRSTSLVSCHSRNAQTKVPLFVYLAISLRFCISVPLLNVHLQKYFRYLDEFCLQSNSSSVSTFCGRLRTPGTNAGRYAYHLHCFPID